MIGVVYYDGTRVRLCASVCAYAMCKERVKSKNSKGK